MVVCGITFRRSVLFVLLCSLVAVTAVSRPLLTKTRNRLLGFKVREPMTLPCRTFGKSLLRYEWIKDGELLSTSNSDKFKVSADNGALTIVSPTESDEGVYQCFATNEFGRAMGSEILLKKATLEHFPMVEPVVHRPVIGSPLTLRCQPPPSFPRGMVYWGEFHLGGKLKPVEPTERISLDYEGNLHFANILIADGLEPYVSYACSVENNLMMSVVIGSDQLVKPVKGSLHFTNIETSDGHAGRSYFCVINNPVLRSLVQGDDQIILPRVVTASPKYQSPTLMWSSEATETVLVGETAKMKCIFSGYPTPTVSWKRIDGTTLLPANARQESFGHEIVIHDVSSEDAGRYQCMATNTVTGPLATNEILLNVESVPSLDSPLQDVDTVEDEDVQFTCLASGIPKPSVIWYSNGRLLNDTQNPRLAVNRGTLQLKQVTKADTQMLQCNASNRHGYILVNVYLNVRAEPPSFIKVPNHEIKVAEGRPVALTCRSVGAPKPIVVWQRIVALTPLVIATANNTESLLILNATRHDNGTYQCVTSNKYGSESARIHLLVRKPTVILEALLSQTIISHSSLSLRCRAATDEEEKSRLRVDWYFNEQRIAASGPRHTVTFAPDGGLSVLSFSQIHVADTGNYSCVASNGIDAVNSSAVLVVKDLPEPPQNVTIVGCEADSAVLTWLPAVDNNDPVINYTVRYKIYPDGQFHDAPAAFNDTSAVVRLLPWRNYTFSVSARNLVGVSGSSSPSQEYCRTPEAVPSRHPHGVCTESQAANQLVIVWQALPKQEHNGEDFHYVVRYRLLSDDDDLSLNSTETVVMVTNWRQTRLVVDNQPIFVRYEISVSAANSQGNAAEERLQLHIGYSGEDAPLCIPTNIRLDATTLNNTSVELLWDPVDESPEVVRGFFRGYQMRFWRTDSPQPMITENVIIRSTDRCGLLKNSTEKRSKRDAEAVRGRITKLWPNAAIAADVLVLNGAQLGQPSETIKFQTPEGVPGPVKEFVVTEIGSNHVRVSWWQPLEPNGIVIKYVIRCEPVSDRLLEFQEMSIAGWLSSKKIVGLRSNTQYVLSIWAVTSAGHGIVSSTQVTTLQMSAPDKPSVIDIIEGDDFLVVSWNPSIETVAVNPGSMFHIEYHRTDESKWQLTPSEVDRNWINITGLSAGADYECLVIAVNGAGDMSASDRVVATVGQKHASLLSSSMSPVIVWLVIILCIVVFVLLLVVLLICVIKYNRGVNYPVYKKEQLRGCDERSGQKDFEFGEFLKPKHSRLRELSAWSMDSAARSYDSEDSLAEYGEPGPDPAKFNEDGSFIGQYGSGTEDRSCEVEAANSHFGLPPLALTL